MFAVATARKHTRTYIFLPCRFAYRCKNLSCFYAQNWFVFPSLFSKDIEAVCAVFTGCCPLKIVGSVVGLYAISVVYMGFVLLFLAERIRN
jgi:hypothetical protein